MSISAISNWIVLNTKINPVGEPKNQENPEEFSSVALLSPACFIYNL